MDVLHKHIHHIGLYHIILRDHNSALWLSIANECRAFLTVVHYSIYRISAVFRPHYKMSDTRNTAVNKRTERFGCTESLVVFDLLVYYIKVP